MEGGKESVLFTCRSVQHLHFGILKTQCFRALDIFVSSVINGM